MPDMTGLRPYRQSRRRVVSFKASLFHFIVMAVALMATWGTAQGQQINLVGFGDSLMAGYQLAPHESYPAQMEAALRKRGHDVAIANAGVSGDTTSGGLSRVDWSVPDGTDGVILELGANDALRGIPAEQSEKNLDNLLARLKDRNIPVLLMGMLAPPNMGGDYAEKFNPIYKKLADKYELPLYPFFLDGVVTVSALQLEDGMHPNGKGVAELVQRACSEPGMAAYRPLDAPTIARELSRLDGWTLSSDGRCITKTFMFASFPAAFAFMSECAQAAERLNHHPDWSNSYTRVEETMSARTVALALALTFVGTGLASAQTPNRIQQFKAWGAYSYKSGNSTVCYVLSVPTTKEPANVDHGDIFFIVSQRPGQNISYEPQAMVGYALQANSKITVTIDKKNFTMFTKDKAAWVENAAEEPALDGRMSVSEAFAPAAIKAPLVANPDLFSAKPSLIGLTRETMSQALKEKGVPDKQVRMRVSQLWHWLYIRGVSDFDAMTNVAKDMREMLKTHFTIARPEIVEEQVSNDGTRKWLLRFPPRGAGRPVEVETVYIPEEGRGTLCISSQVGCSLTCSFCHTGTQRLVRNLTAEEILGQLLLARDRLGDFPGADTPPGAFVPTGERKVTNIVMMGMGEPLYNFESVKTALLIATDGDGLSLSKRRVTLSTSGVVPEIYRTGEEIGVMLAISLHAVRDELRDMLVPINKKYPLKELLDACRAYPSLSNARRITFEYVMLKDVNDSLEDAKLLVQLLKGIPAKINLIPFNPWPGTNYQCSDWATIEKFADFINQAGYASPIRTPRGRDILAACGQLKSESERMRKTERLAFEAMMIAGHGEDDD
eukprot:g18164.t1